MTSLYRFFRSASALMVSRNTGHSLTVSLQHLVYSAPKRTDQNGLEKNANVKSFRPVFASAVKKGDSVLVHDNYKGLELGVVASVKEREIVGLYSPVTYEGNMIVDDVLASCYSDFDSHELQHLAFAPFRWMYTLLKFVPASQMKPDDTNGLLNHVDYGVYWYGQGLHVFANAVLPWNVWGGHSLI